MSWSVTSRSCAHPLGVWKFRLPLSNNIEGFLYKEETVSLFVFVWLLGTTFLTCNVVKVNLLIFCFGLHHACVGCPDLSRRQLIDFIVESGRVIVKRFALVSGGHLRFYPICIDILIYFFIRPIKYFAVFLLEHLYVIPVFLNQLYKFFLRYSH